jgi:hypothetical protein
VPRARTGTTAGPKACPIAPPPRSRRGSTRLAGAVIAIETGMYHGDLLVDAGVTLVADGTS